MPSPYEIVPGAPPGLPDISGAFPMPNMPDFRSMTQGLSGVPTFNNVAETIKASGNVPGVAQTISPTLYALLAPGGQASSPYTQDIMRQTQGNVAAAQSDAMKRGLTGSDIESQGMTEARSAGQTAIAQHYGQTAAQLATLIQQAVTGDVNSNREILLQLAQAMGQELTSQRDLEMFQKQMQMSMDIANKQAKSQMWSAGIGALGSLGGAALGGAMGGAGLAPGLAKYGIGQGGGSMVQQIASSGRVGNYGWGP